MKRKFIFCILIAIILVVTVSNAAFATDTEILNLESEVSSKIINRNIYNVDNLIEISNEVVNGSIYLVGEKVNIKDETINGDIYICADELTIDKNTVINGNCFIVALDAKIDGNLKRDLFIAAKEINLSESSQVGYDMNVAGEHVILGGTFMRDVNGTMSILEIMDTTKIFGQLNYSSENEATISDKAEVETINFEKKIKEKKKVIDIVIDYVLSFTKYFVFTMIFMIVVIKLLPRYLEKMASYVNVSSFGTGIISLIIVPVFLVLLLLLKVTSYVSFAILTLFILLLLISLAVSNVAVGKLIENKHGKRKLPIWTALITLITWIMFQIPVAGGIVAFIWIMLGLGISIRYTFSRKNN